MQLQFNTAKELWEDTVQHSSHIEVIEHPNAYVLDYETFLGENYEELQFINETPDRIYSSRDYDKYPGIHWALPLT